MLSEQTALALEVSLAQREIGHKLKPVKKAGSEKTPPPPNTPPPTHTPINTDTFREVCSGAGGKKAWLSSLWN